MTLQDKLYNACVNNDIKLVNKLINDDRVDINKNSGVAFSKAVLFGHIEIVKLMLANKKLKPQLGGNSAILRVAIFNNRLEIFKLLLKDRRIQAIKIHPGVLEETIQFERKEMFNILLYQKKLNPSHADQLSLKIACQNDTVYYAEMLLKHKEIDINYFKNNSDYVNPLLICVMSGSINVLKIILKHKNIEISEDLEKALDIRLKHLKGREIYKLIQTFRTLGKDKYQKLSEDEIQLSMKLI